MTHWLCTLNCVPLLVNVCCVSIAEHMDSTCTGTQHTSDDTSLKSVAIGYRSGDSARAQQLRERQAREMREAEERLRADWANDEVSEPIRSVRASACVKLDFRDERHQFLPHQWHTHTRQYPTKVRIVVTGG